ncbi:MAG: FAD-dependent thymidylate synthase [Microcoleaceae cyanobacterium]
MDRFRVELISKTPNPQQVIYAAMHQDYTGEFVYDGRDSWPNESECGEIIVKRLLAGNRGHYGCFSADTEVLTAKGWLGFPLVTKETQLLAVDPSKGSAHFEIPSAIQAIEFNSADKMYSVESQYLNFLVTRDHRMLVSSRQSGGSFSSWRFEEAREIYNKPVRYLLNTHLDESQRFIPEIPPDIDPFTTFKLAGFYFGDGLRSHNINPGVVRFRIRRPRKIAYLKSLGLPLSEMKGDRYTVRSESLASWVHSNFQDGQRKTIPVWMLTLPYDLVEAFWDGLKNSDGTRVKEQSWSYDSVEKDALSMVQAIAHINGFSANMTLNNPNVGESHENHRPCWRLTISEHSTRRVESCQKNRSPGVKEDWVNYSGKVYCATVSTGALMVRRKGKVVVLGNCLEHPQIVLNCGYFPHSVMQQARTHRVGVSFDCQSFRYTSQQFLAVLKGKKEIEDVFYLRPVGNYRDRKGKNYYYSLQQRESDLNWCEDAIKRYQQDIEAGFAEEHARGKLPFDYRQHFVVSFNLRSLLHFLDLRSKKDAQLEIQQLCDLMLPHLEAWVPDVAEWYKNTRLGKARLSP